METRVSIIVPVYNCEAYVAECLNSLLAQTCGDWEAVCVDDASTDASLEAAKAVAGEDLRFRFVEHEANHGLSVARNTGLAAAQGEFVMFLDSDDLLEPQTLERLLEVADAHELDLVDFNATVFYEPEAERRLDLEEAYATRPKLDGVRTGPELFCFYQAKRHYCCPACFHFVRRSLLLESGLEFAPGLLHEDELFSPLLHAAASRAMFLKEDLYRYRIRPASIVGSARGVRNMASLFEITRRMHAWLQEHAADYDDAFVDAFAQRIFEIRTMVAEDVLSCSDDVLAELLDGFSPQEHAEFSEQVLALADYMQQLRSSRTWRMGNALASIPRGIARLARK